MSRQKKKDTENTLLSWATDVLHIQRTPRGSSRETVAQSALREWVDESSANKKEFFKVMIPKAIDLLVKHGRDGESVRTVAEDKNSVSELQEMLAEMVEKAKNPLNRQGTFIVESTE